MMQPLPSKVHGPEEPWDDHFVTTRTHTIREIEDIYKVLLFTGIPPYNTPETFRFGLAAERFLQENFRRYGSLTDFRYDSTIGTGSVTFQSGEEAEACYHVMNFSPLFHAESLLYLEFAAYLPFLNPVRSMPFAQDVTRQMLRNLPRKELHAISDAALVQFRDMYAQLAHDATSIVALVQQILRTMSSDARSVRVLYVNFVRYRLEDVSASELCTRASNLERRSRGDLTRAIQLLDTSTIRSLTDPIEEGELDPLTVWKVLQFLFVEFFAVVKKPLLFCLTALVISYALTFVVSRRPSPTVEL